MVGINEGTRVDRKSRRSAASSSPGLGREGSKYGLDEYTELKYMMMGGLGR